MTFALSPGELSLLNRSIAVLLSPHDFPNTMAWRTEAARLVQTLIGNDTTVITLPEDPEPLCCWSAPHDLIPRGLEFLGRDPGDSYIDRLPSRAWTHRGVLESAPGGRRAYLATNIYHGYFKPCRVLDAIGVYGGKTGGMLENPTILCYGSEEGARFANDRGAWLLSFLWAPLTAGWAAWHATVETRQTLGAAVDALGSGLAVYDVSGALIHQNRCLTDWFRGDRDGQLRFAVDEVAAAVSGSRALSRRSVSRVVVAKAGGYRINGALGRTPFGRDDAVLVSVTPVPKTWTLIADQSDLRHRFGLTDAEARVAALVAEGRRNDDIATLLGVSPHTVRHQTERVLRKLRVDSRVQVAGRLGRPVGRTPSTNEE